MTSSKQFHRTQSARGFSLIESLFSVVIVGLCILGISAGVNFCIASLESNRQWARSTDILLSEAERLSLLRWDVIESGQFPTQFTARLFPNWNATNELEDVSTQEGLSTQAFNSTLSTHSSDNEPSANSPTNHTYEGNTLFTGTIELKPFLETNTLGYNSDLRRALISLTWEHNGRTRTQSLELNLAKTALNSFQEHPAKSPPPFDSAFLQSALETWEKEQEATP